MKRVELISMPGKQYHFGEILPEEEEQHLNAITPFPSSDLLFSALINIWRKVFGDASVLVKNFQEDDIRISSAFFFIRKNEKAIRFLPKPVTANLYQIEEHKKLKKIDFVSEGIINNGVLPEEWLKPDRCSLLDGKLVCLKDELSETGLDSITVYKEVTIPKVKVHTPEKDSCIYSQTNIMFPVFERNDIETGYYFYLDEHLPTENQEKFLTVLNLLADEGLGGDRSTGCGQFKEVRLTKASIPRGPSENYLSLSLTNPSTEERDAFAFYRIVTRGGRRVNGNKQLKLVNMIGEGSIVTRPVSGRIVDISPDNDGSYRRYGRTLLYPLPSNFEMLWKTQQNT
ncbi:type III-A CRISPR-associated RAMP protein Csm4 [Anaerophaga thermohalophila]|uniref:type III-A CRISPR-associated RAMP protein Csm4 n=1 Tax=Anaerophaga thermohalophila TaxID=177400 RepID=UPI000237C8E8|nr:type III-A CRISPR-associated RAMP protein Csm4 [Anaerophaga thermohalophila]